MPMPWWPRQEGQVVRPAPTLALSVFRLENKNLSRIYGFLFRVPEKKRGEKRETENYENASWQKAQKAIETKKHFRIKRKENVSRRTCSQCTETWSFINPGKIDMYVACEIRSCVFSVKSGDADDISRSTRGNSPLVRLFLKIFVCP